MVWPFQKKCKTKRDDRKRTYELILDINDNPFVRRFWVKSRIRQHKKWRRDRSLIADHDLDITIKYRVGGQEIEESFRKTAEGRREVTWGKTISGGIGGGSEEVRPISIVVDGEATRRGKTFVNHCEKRT